MRKIILAACLLCFCLFVNAQPNNSRTTLNESSVVKDTSGAVLPYAVWHPLMMNSNYSVRVVDPKVQNPEFVIFRVSEAQKNAMMERMPKPRESNSFRTGKPFNSFSEDDINGKKFKLKELKGKVIVLNFWFINCPPCRMEIPELNEMVHDYKTNEDVVFIAIALDNRDQLKDFLKTMPFEYNIIDNGRYLAEKYDVKSFPTHVVINRQGNIDFHTMGLAKNTVYWLKKSIDAALQMPAGNDVVAQPAK